MFHDTQMPKTVQIRSMPDDVYKSLQMRAIQAGTSLSAFLLKEITHIANRPSIDEVAARLSRSRRRSTKIDFVRLTGQTRSKRQALLVSPSGSTSRCSRTRSSLGWIADGRSS